MENEYLEVLIEENSIISEVLLKQNELKEAVNKKNWTELLEVISKINNLMDSFNKLDEKRETLASSRKNDSENEKSLLVEVRGKLVKCRAENKALSDYINITRGFVQRTIDEALPQSKNKLYSRKGYIVQQPASVVVNTLF